MDQHYDTSPEDLLVKYLLGETSREETRTVEEWLAASPGNQHYYQQVKLIWEKSLLLPAGTLRESDDDEEKAWRIFKEKIHRPARPRPIISLRWAATAAAAVILLPILFIALFGWPGSRTMQVLSSNNSILPDTLPDGTTVILSRHSTLSRQKKFNRRTVALQGEAWFRVATNKDRPFQIASNGITITVLGTSFNVRTDPAETDITVETGLVKVSNTHGATEVGAGETITIRPDDQRLQKHPAAPAIYHFYQPREFVCRDTPLWQLTDALQRSYGVPIILGDTTLRQLRISTSFHN
ncbi:MAG TPA: FecR domain-containing protein, partial [Puia sp.]|nr:FecR domain-containing protein [Puia sp.]